MKENSTIIDGIRRGVVNALNRKMHAENGAYFITAAGSCPAGNYYAFEASADGATISAIDYGDNATLYSGDLTLFELIPGNTYFIKYKSITISAGALICYKD